MTNQERKNIILNKLKNIIYFVLGITVLFLSIQSIIMAHGKVTTILLNLIWVFLCLIIIIEGCFGIKHHLEAFEPKQRLFQLIDWLIIILGIIISNIGYVINKHPVILIGIVIFIAGCIPINPNISSKKSS